MYKYIMFDLDGTLTDPGIGITNGVMNALRKFNMTIPPRTELYKFIGPPLKDSFMEYMGMDEAQALQAIEYYREYYSVTGLFENTVYPDIPELLAELKAHGYTLIVATSKPYEFTERILSKFGLISYFDFVAGATMDGSRGTKAEVITYALSHMNIRDTGEVLMIGDRHHDIDGAHACDIKAVGVTYGYGDRAEHINDGADYIVDTVDEIARLLIPEKQFRLKPACQ